MTIRFACPSCNAVLSAPDDKAGFKGDCPRCGQRLQIPKPPRRQTVLGRLLRPGRAPPPRVVPSPQRPAEDVEEPFELPTAELVDPPPPRKRKKPPLKIVPEQPDDGNVPGALSIACGMVGGVVSCASLELCFLSCALGMLLGLIGLIVSACKGGRGIVYPLLGIGICIAVLWYALGMGDAVEEARRRRRIQGW